MHAGQAAFLSRRLSTEAHFTHSCENIWSRDQLLPLCLCHPLPLCSHPGRGSRRKAQGSENREGKNHRLPSANHSGAGRQRSCGRQSAEAIWHACQADTWQFFPPPRATPACFAFISTSLHFSQLRSPFCCQSLWSTAVGPAWWVKAHIGWESEKPPQV